MWYTYDLQTSPRWLNYILVRCHYLKCRENCRTIYIYGGLWLNAQTSWLPIQRCYSMLHAWNQLNGFPKSVTIPSNSPVCPGCTQGKMPASAFLLSETRASTSFEHIYSDLKSFPVVFYHKYRYFVSFIDDFTSYAWIVLLYDKASAITTLK